jgi:hypothetical protein
VAASELSYYSNILKPSEHQKYVKSHEKSKAWSTESVQAQLRDAANHDSELKNYQNILTFSDAPDIPKKEQHQRALQRGSERADEILTFPPVESKSANKQQKEETGVAKATEQQQQQQSGEKTAAGNRLPRRAPARKANARQNPTAQPLNAAKASAPKQQAAPRLSSLQAILIRPPPASADQTNALMKEWHDVYAEAQDLAAKQAQMAMRSADAHGTTLKMTTTPMEAIIIRPPPMDIDKSNPVFREWREVYARAQDLAIRQALLQLQSKINKEQTPPKAAASSAHHVTATVSQKSRVEQLAQKQPIEDKCLQCTHAWSEDALGCLKASCKHLAGVDMQQLALDNHIASVLARYMPPSDGRVAVVSGFVMPADGASGYRAWIRVRDSPGLVGLGLQRGTTTSLTMEHTHLVSAAGLHMLHETSGVTLEQALKPLMQMQEELNKARNHKSSAKKLVELSWAPTLGFTPYYAHPETRTLAAEPVMRAIQKPLPVHKIPSLASIETENESAALAGELRIGDEALEQTLLHKQELLDALEPEARATERAQANMMGRAGEQLAGQVRAFMCI